MKFLLVGTLFDGSRIWGFTLGLILPQVLESIVFFSPIIGRITLLASLEEGYLEFYQITFLFC